MKKLRVLSIGAGAIGTYIGGSLALQGHEVAFLERPEVVNELKGRGLRLRKDEGESTDQLGPDEVLFVNSMDEALSAGAYDIALYALKSFDTPTFISNLQPTTNNQKSIPPFL